MNIDKSQNYGAGYSPTGLIRFALAVGCIALATLLSASCGGGGGNGDAAVYSSNEDGLTGIYMVDPSSGSVTRLTSTAGEDSTPVWSPDRRRIAFISDRTGSPNVWVMGADGGSEELPFRDMEPVADFRWAPDSNRISLLLGDESGGRIFIGDLEAGTTELLTTEEERVQLGGWSPDGEWVVYAVLDGDRAGLHKKNPRGVQEIKITSGSDTNPVWSPKGDLIAFNRPGDGVLSIFVVGPDGDDEKVLYNTTGADTSFEWSPDGRRLVFVSDQDGNREIYMIDVNGEDAPVRLTRNRASDDYPHWSKDGKRILFSSDNDGDFDLYTMHLDGSSQRRITTSDTDEVESDW